jgi:hypothetical protein
VRGQERRAYRSNNAKLMAPMKKMKAAGPLPVNNQRVTPAHISIALGMEITNDVFMEVK